MWQWQVTVTGDSWEWQETATGDSDRGQMTGDRWMIVTKYQMLYSEKGYKEQTVQERYSLIREAFKWKIRK